MGDYPGFSKSAQCYHEGPLSGKQKGQGQREMGRCHAAGCEDGGGGP